MKMIVKKAEQMKMLENMLLIRLFEERGKTLIEEGEITGKVHQYIGEEAVAVGVCSALYKDDVITSTHRGHGHILAKGGDVKKLMAELGGKETGYCRGKGGTMHITSLELGILGANGMVGQGVPIALGAAFANKFKGNNNVAVAFFGEGAANEGAIHEAMNMASIWKLPMIFVCENNHYAVSTSASDSVSVENIADRAQGYGMESMVVDGMDVLTVFDAAKEAVKRARNGEGPTFIECKTYRYYGHFAGEDNVLSEPYRKEAEVDFYRKLDPIIHLKFLLMEERVPEAVFTGIEKKVKQIIEDAVTFMKESPYPEPAQAYEGAYAHAHESMPVKGWSIC
jgi:pyruvate dehydrogenase E1 component alpha subunit